VVALLGLGEAGAALAADLVAAGVETRGWDPDERRAVDGVARAESAVDAVSGAAVVLSVNGQSAALAAARSVAVALGPEQLYADLNTASAGVKREVAAEVAPSGALFADVALLAPVPGNGLRTPALVSGPGAPRFADVFAPLGMPVETLGDEPGEAATRKLLRSVFMKGLAAAAIESLGAGEAAGCEPWLREQILTVLDEPLLDRLLSGSRQHAVRRVDEMEAAAALVAELGLEPNVAHAAAQVLARLAPPAPPRPHARRKADTLARLRGEVDCWVASADENGDAYLVPLSFVWHDEALTVATPRASRTARNLIHAGRARVTLGPTRDVVVVDGTVEALRLGADSALEEAHAHATGFDPRTEREEYVYLRIAPTGIQAWREANELAGRQLMRHGAWLDRRPPPAGP